LDPANVKTGENRDLSDYEIASRLSYFLWSSKPDSELYALAAQGELHKPEVLQKQAQRMLQDWRAHAFVENFGGQWLQIRNIWDVNIDPDTFPGWKEDLKGLMKEETERFFEAIMKENRPVTDLIDADFTFLNEELAHYYGIEGVKGKEFQRVTLPKDSPRGGVLTQGSVLVSSKFSGLRPHRLRRMSLRSRSRKRSARPPPCASAWSSIGAALNVPAAMPRWTPSALPSKTSTPPARGATRMENSPSMPPASSPMAPPFRARAN